MTPAKNATTPAPAKGFQTIEWTGRDVRLLDQTLLPGRTVYKTIRTPSEMWEAIKTLRVRGAPAIGVAAAYGVYLGVKDAKASSREGAVAAARKAADYLETSRPTAVNLFWAMDHCRRVLDAIPPQATARSVAATLLDTARRIQADDEARCAAIARHGAPLLDGARGVLTHCNAGALATAGVGTAVGVIVEALRGTSATVYVDETRPLLQGARLTAWELGRAAIDYRVITDSMAASAMQRGYVQAVVTGADRIAANGDSANKIGTLPLAICARHFKVPFYIAAPLSTIDFDLKTGKDIPIEERADEEITVYNGARTTPPGARTFNPAFDVTPARLIAGIITEVGVVERPYRRGLAAARERGESEFGNP